MVGSLVGFHRFQVGHVTHDRVLIHDAVGAQEVPGLAGAILAVPMLMLFKFICDETPGLAAVSYFMRR